MRNAKGGREALIDAFSDFPISISDDKKYCDCFPEASPSHTRMVIIIISHIAGGRLAEPVPTIRAAQIQSNSACWSDHVHMTMLPTMMMLMMIIMMIMVMVRKYT